MSKSKAIGNVNFNSRKGPGTSSPPITFLKFSMQAAKPEYHTAMGAQKGNAANILVSYA